MTAEPAPEIAEFGDEADGTVERQRGFLTALGDDPRLVPVIAGLAGVAAFGSLVGEWFTISQAGDSNELRHGVTGAATLGSAYLVGVLVLAGLVMTVIAGPPRARHGASVAGLGVAGAMLAVLIAVPLTIGDYFAAYYGGGPGTQLTFTMGRGLTAAFAAVILTIAALVLAGRLLRHPPAEAETAEADVPRQPPVDWAWRRPRRQSIDPDVEPAPIDLTVQPANPFARPDSAPER